MYINILEKSDQIYGYTPKKDNDRNIFGETFYDSQSGKVMISDCTFNGKISMARLAHEVEHAWQFESGEISFGAKEGNKMANVEDIPGRSYYKQFKRGLLDINDEYDAYNIQGLFGITQSRQEIVINPQYKDCPKQNIKAIDFGKLEALRTQLTNADVYIYKYKPGVGKSECILPDGNKVCYHYDLAGRLSHTTDKNGNILDVYDYHYKQ